MPGLSLFSVGLLFRENAWMAPSPLDQVIQGTNGPDNLEGTSAADVIDGFDGIDHLFGMAGDDTLRGGGDTDEIHGGEGDDLCQGDGGDDHLDGEDGDDRLEGGLGSDVLRGGVGNDWLGVDGNENSRLEGQEGDDTLFGAGGDDDLTGEDGRDVIDGGGGDDTIVTGTGADRCSGGDGDDVLLDTGGRDTLRGGAGADRFLAHGGETRMYGEAGDDELYIGADFAPAAYYFDGGDGADQARIEEIGVHTVLGGAGDDVVEVIGSGGAYRGGDGADRLYFIGGELDVTAFGDAGDDFIDLSNDRGGSSLSRFTLAGGGGIDTLEIDARLVESQVRLDLGRAAKGGIELVGDHGQLTGFEVISVRLPNSDDIVTGYSYGDFLGGLGGDDTLRGGGGADTLNGGKGDDRLSGDTGDDRIDGGTDADSIAGMDGNDVLVGDAGDDRLDGGKGWDTCESGDGDDVILISAGHDKIDGGRDADWLDGSMLNVGLTIDFAKETVRGKAVETEFLNIEHARGGQQADRLLGARDGNILEGLGGGDILDGGAGADTLVGGTGADRLSGGDGADVFTYVETGESVGKGKDTIRDLQGSDTIDLAAIDADDLQTGDQAFRLVSAFSGAAGELTLSYSAGKNRTVLSGDVDGDGKADFVVFIAGDHADFDNFVL